MPYLQDQLTATIANAATVSDAQYIGDKIPVALQMPAAFTGTAMTFQGSWDGTTYQAINTAGSAYSETVAASKMIYLDGSKFIGFRFIKLVSGSTEGAQRLVGIMIRRPDKTW